MSKRVMNERTPRVRRRRLLIGSGVLSAAIAYLAFIWFASVPRRPDLPIPTPSHPKIVEMGSWATRQSAFPAASRQLAKELQSDPTSDWFVIRWHDSVSKANYRCDFRYSRSLHQLYFTQQVSNGGYWSRTGNVQLISAFAGVTDVAIQKAVKESGMLSTLDNYGAHLIAGGENRKI